MPKGTHWPKREKPLEGRSVKSHLICVRHIQEEKSRNNVSTTCLGKDEAARQGSGHSKLVPMPQHGTMLMSLAVARHHAGCTHKALCQQHKQTQAIMPGVQGNSISTNVGDVGEAQTS
eukprot:1157635-Pelagomonas_calceolata.AAC.4